MNADSRSTCIYIVRYERTKHTEFKDQDLNSLQEFIFPVCFLKAKDVVILGKLCKIDVLLFPGML